MSGPYVRGFPVNPSPPRSGQDRSLQARVNGRFVGRGIDPLRARSSRRELFLLFLCRCRRVLQQNRSPLYRIFCRTFSTMVCSVRAVPVRTQSFRARVTPVYKRLR